MDVRFAPFATHLMVGPSGSGKTFRTADILRCKNDIIRGGERIKNVIFCYASWQKVYDDLSNEGIVTKWINHCPSNEEFIELVQDFKEDGGSILVIDDFMGAIGKDLVEIVTVTARHNKTTTFILFQSLFPSNPLARQISLNVKYIHVHKNPRENAQIQFLARQLRPGNYKWIVDAYHDATKKPFTAFLIDLMQESPESIRFRSNILPKEFPMRVYASKGELQQMARDQ